MIVAHRRLKEPIKRGGNRTIEGERVRRKGEESRATESTELE